MTPSTKTFATRTLFALASLACASACIETFVADDVSFDRWCGDTLCDWQVDSGRIEKVGSWHRSDSAVRLLGTPAQISQVQSFEDEPCLHFALIGDVEPETETTLQLDFNADGSVDFSRPLPTEPWRPVGFTLRAPTAYRGVAFILHKAGPGRAVISQMAPSALDPSACDDPPLELEPQRDGAYCETDEGCAEGICAGGQCSLCAEEGSCPRGASCDEDAHCARGACTVDVCSPCGDDTDCEAGQACALASYPFSNERACIDEQDLEPRELGQACSRDAQCKHGYACSATGDDLTPRCGMACRGKNDDGCRAGAQCVRLLTYFDEDWNAEDAFTCIAEEDCEHAALGECLDLDGEPVEL